MGTARRGSRGTGEGPPEPAGGSSGRLPDGTAGEDPGRLRGVTIREVLAMPALAGTDVLAGRGGLDRVVQRLNVMEVPDILPWVKAHELLLTTAYPLRHEPDRLPRLVAALHQRRLAGMAVKEGRYLDAMPPAALEQADALDFPILRLPAHVAFDDILDEVLTTILNRQAAALARAERTHRALIQIVLSGGGLAEIARDLSVLVDGPTAVVGVDGSVLAAAELGGELDESALDGPGQLAVDVHAGGRAHGRLVAFERGRPFDAEDRVTLENAATVAALAIMKSQAVAAVEAKFRSDFLHDLIGGRVATVDEAVSRGAALGWRLDRPVLVAVVEWECAAQPAHPGAANDPHERLVAAASAATARHDPQAAVVDFGREVVVLTGAPPGPDTRAAGRAAAQRLHADLKDALGGLVSVGMGRAARDALAIPAAYRQATRAIEIGRQTGAAGSVAHFDDLGVFRLLSLVPEHDELRAFVRESLGPLAGGDRQAADLRRTLATLLDVNLNVAEAARRLHFHYNTMRYRVEKLESLVGPFTTDPQVRLNVAIALQALRMRGIAAEAAMPSEPAAQP